MTVRKVTVSLPEEVASAIEATVTEGGAPNFSAAVTARLVRALAAEQSLRALRAHTGGPPDPQLLARAQRALGIAPDRKAL